MFDRIKRIWFSDLMTDVMVYGGLLLCIAVGVLSFFVGG